MMSIKPQFKGNIGMFLVCAELSKRNLIAMPTSRNTKGYDVVILNPETNVAVGVQVKCSDRKEFPILSSHWKDYLQKLDENITADFIFVDISDLEKPNYFIVDKEGFKYHLKSAIKKYAGKCKEKHRLTWEQMLERENREKRKPHLWTVKIADIERGKNNWKVITHRLAAISS